jgi:hypothetical protein
MRKMLNLAFTLRVSPSFTHMRKIVRYASVGLCALSLLLPQFVVAQKSTTPSPAKLFELTVDSIMRGPRLVIRRLASIGRKTASAFTFVGSRRFQPQHENFDPQAHALNECLLEEVGTLAGDACAVLCLLQLLPDSL